MLPITACWYGIGPHPPLQPPLGSSGSGPSEKEAAIVSAISAYRCSLVARYTLQSAINGQPRSRAPRLPPPAATFLQIRSATPRAASSAGAYPE